MPNLKINSKIRILHRRRIDRLGNQGDQELPEEYRKAFEMNRFGHLTYNEIAERTGVSPKTIAYRISQSLKILRTELKEYMPLFLALLH